MIPPLTKWINDIKVKLGFSRTMTASGADVVDAVNKQSDQIDDLGPYNGLDSTSTAAALAAAQGKTLKQLIDNIASQLQPVQITDANAFDDAFKFKVFYDWNGYLVQKTGHGFEYCNLVRIPSADVSTISLVAIESTFTRVHCYMINIRNNTITYTGTISVV